MESRNKKSINMKLVRAFILLICFIAGYFSLTIINPPKKDEISERTVNRSETQPKPKATANTQTEISVEKIDAKKSHPLTAGETKDNKSRGHLLSENDLADFVYYPVFSSDSASSHYQGSRKSFSELETELATVQGMQPYRKIYQSIGNQRIIVIPISGEGNFLHFKFLNNFAEKETELGHCHLSELLIADSDGKLLDNKNYTFFANESVLESYPGEGIKNIIDGDYNSLWHTAIHGKATPFPYRFSLDLKQHMKQGYLVFVYRNGRGEYARPQNMEYLLTNEEKPSANYITLNTTDYVLSNSSLKKHDYFTADAAGVISLPHYGSEKLSNEKLIWKFWVKNKGTFTAIKQLPDGKNEQEVIEVKSGVNTFIAGKNVKAVRLLPSENLQAILNAQKTTTPNYTAPDLSKVHPEIIRKFEKITAGKYDIRTTIPEKIKAGKNGYLIITTSEKQRSLTMLDAFILHKKSKGFDVSVITEKDYGGGVGVPAALNIRKWLKENHRAKNALYLLMLGNPDPRKGDVPYKKVGMDKKAMPEIKKQGLEAYKNANPKFDKYDGIWPTDYFYVDLTGDWDLNKNGIYADDGDYGAGGIDGQPEVYVGRIPFYGVDAEIGNASDVDTILARIIRYENQGGDLSWRHNIYYAGDTFQRTQTFYNDFMSHNGAKLVRHTHSPNMLFSPDIDHYKEHETVLAQNSDKFGFVYYQEHGSPWGIGMMSTGGTEKLKDRYPPVYALGGCDVASPEFPENVSFALLRNSGIGVYAGTRSVWSCSSNSWAKHTFYYPRLCMGMSTGEVLWSTRADQSRGRTIGGTNFLINLLGDPSIVPMPKVTGSDLSVSPGFDVKLSMIQGDTILPEVEFEIQNNSDKTQEITLEAHKDLKLSLSDTRLSKGEFKRIKASVKSPDSFSTGSHQFKVKFAMNGISTERDIIVQVKPKMRVFYHNFDSPITYLSEGNKKSTGDATQTLVTGKFQKAAHVKDQRAELNVGKFANREGFSLSFYQFLNDDGNYDIIRSKGISVLTRNGKTAVWLSPTGWTVGESFPANIYDGPARKLKRWQYVTVVFNRAERTLSISVDGETQTHQLDFSDNVNFSVNKMELFATKRVGFAVDEMSIYNYPLTKNERRLLAKNKFATPLFPLDGSVVGKAMLEWQSNGRIQLEIASDVGFKDVIFKKTTTHQRVENLDVFKKDGTYFWRVNTQLGSDYIPSNIVRKITIQEGIQPIVFNLKEQGLPAAKVGVSGYNVRIDNFIKDCDRALVKDFIFKKTSGPKWLKIYPDGLLFTNYGATARDKGVNKFNYVVTAPDGTSKKGTFEITVE